MQNYTKLFIIISFCPENPSRYLPEAKILMQFNGFRKKGQTHPQENYDVGNVFKLKSWEMIKVK